MFFICLRNFLTIVWLNQRLIDKTFQLPPKNFKSILNQKLKFYFSPHKCPKMHNYLQKLFVLKIPHNIACSKLKNYLQIDIVKCHCKTLYRTYEKNFRCTEFSSFSHRKIQFSFNLSRRASFENGHCNLSAHNEFNVTAR
jgi:hypothetical protein